VDKVTGHKTASLSLTVFLTRRQNAPPINARFLGPTTTLLLHLFNGLFSRTTWVSRYQKGKTSLDLNEARDDGVLGWR